MTTALILVGHGSHISPHTAGWVWSYVDQLRAWGVADEITAGFWKEQPNLWQVADTVLADEVVIVPVFTAQGYFTRQVIPAEMRLHERRVYYTRTLGEHYAVTNIIIELIQSTLTKYNLQPSQSAVALIGHGTKRNPESRTATKQKAAYLRGINLVSQVIDVYLDDEPDIPSIYDNTNTPHIIAVPFFLAPGSHVTSDVPQALGIDDLHAPQRIKGRWVYYTTPIGIHHTICELILALANETGVSFHKRETTSPWAYFPQVGASALIQAVKNAQTLTFGELRLTPTVVSPPQPGDYAVTSPAELRAIVRENPFRSLSTARGLPGGWHVPLHSIHDLPAVVETIYPGVMAALHLPCDSLTAVGQRQQGIFQHIHQLDHAIIHAAIDSVCTGCVLHPAWFGLKGELPCLTPCNHWLSAIKEQTS
ncbi:MAG: hypothetical protein CUN56_01175 [Phototrophicales bacterium]|nr:MAG: hypothetical protein CUN56_01175 [Phototrophicales bacterium]